MRFSLRRNFWGQKKGSRAAGVLAMVGFILFVALSEISGLPWEDWVERWLLVEQGSETVMENVQVARVVDGDTIELVGGERVRYIGVNAPESVKPNSAVECFGKEASAKNKELVEGQAIRLEKDVSDRDKYGRLLRYVYLEDGTFVNDWLVREGYAYAATFPPDVRYSDQFKQAQQEARKNKRGLWADETCKGKK
jgi:micrococcal nuclease